MNEWAARHKLHSWYRLSSSWTHVQLCLFCCTLSFNRHISLASFSKRVLVLILSYDCKFSFTCKLNAFSQEWLSTRPRFEKEATGNSEMGCCFFWLGKSSQRYLGTFSFLLITAEINLLQVLQNPIQKRSNVKFVTWYKATESWNPRRWPASEQSSIALKSSLSVSWWIANIKAVI